jgi:predicted dinucleotide-binding enzyme
MNISIIGSGNIGGRLAKAWADKGHSIFIGSRDPGNVKIKDLVAHKPEKISAHAIQDSVQKSEVILLAVPASMAYEVGKQLGDVRGKIIIDAMNAIFRRPDGYNKTSEAIKSATGSDHIVKSFNWISAENMDNPRYGNEVADMVLCGNYKEDKAVVKRLAEDCGFNVYDIGGLEKESLTENAAMLLITLATEAGLGRHIAFKILKR